MSDLEIFFDLLFTRIIPGIIGLFVGGWIFFTWWHVHEIKEKQNVMGMALAELLRRTPRPESDFIDVAEDFAEAMAELNSQKPQDQTTNESH